MKRQAEASSAFTHGRSAIGTILAVAFVALLALAPAASAKYVDRVVAGGAASGLLQGQLNRPAGVAINDPTIADNTTDPLGASTDGYVYVADEGNRRIQVFGADDSFKFTFGRGVQSGGDGAEICDSSEVPCTSTVVDDEEGEFDRPRGIAINQVTGDVYVYEHAGRRVQQFTAAGEFIRAWGWDVSVGGDTGFEICTSGCKAGTSGTGGGQFASIGFTANPTGIAVDPVAPHHVFVSDDENNRLQEFEADGDFVRLWGHDVVGEGKTGDTGIGFEICSSTAPEVCKKGIKLEPETVAPPYSGTTGGRHLVVDDAGILYASKDVLDQPILRFNTNESDAADLLLPWFTLDTVTGVPAGTFPSEVRNDYALALDIDRDSGNLFAGINLESSIPSTWSKGVLEIANPGTTPTFVGKHVVNSGISVGGIALHPGTGDLYLTGSIFDHRLFAADEDGSNPPAVSFIRTVTGVEAHSATFTGCADPKGTNPFTASYRFQYSVDGVNWTDVAPAVNLGTAAIDCDNPASEVTATAAGLLANTTYRVRMVTNRQFGGPDIPSTAETSFVTDALSPDVVTFAPSNRTDTSAVLGGSINPHGAETTYRFQWGKTASYGKEIPATPGSAGGGGKPEFFSHLIEGLTPEATYHYRLCAQSVKGSSCGEDRVFTTRSSFGGFAARGYEQVTRVGAINESSHETPVQTRLYLGIYGALAPVAADGDGVVHGGNGFTPDEPFGDPIFQGRQPTVISYRSGEGWQTKAAGQRQADTSMSSYPRFTFWNSEADRGILSTDSGWLGDLAPQGGTYLRDYGAGTNSLLYASTGANATQPKAASRDLSHVVVESGPRLIPSLGPGNAVTKVYEWDEEAGELKLASRDLNGNPLTGQSQLGGSSAGGIVGQGTGLSPDYDAVSEDGRHIYISNPTTGNAVKIYRRSDGETTILASPSKRISPDPLGQRGKIYEAASADGDRVFFTSQEHLTDDANTGPTRAGRDLYRYEASTDTLVDLSAETNTANGARVQKVLGISEDGDWAYYVAQGQPIPGKGVEGKRNIYAWHDDGSAGGETRFVATLGDGAADTASIQGVAEDQFNGVSNVPNGEPGPATANRSHVATGGRALVFQSAESLTGQPTRGHAQVYIWEADAENGAGALSCASCRPDASPSGNEAEVSAVYTGSSAMLTDPSNADRDSGRAISADGSRVFFHSNDALLPGDKNDAADVYLWEEGRLSLVSTGESEQNSYFIGMSPDGEDAFFFTDSKLVGQDNPDTFDLYDYRVGGGLASQNQPPPGEPCVADACKPATESPPTYQTPQSSSKADDNYVFPLEVISPNAKARSRAAKQGKLAIGVIANQTGRITVKAMKGRKVFGTGSKTVFKTGPTSVLLKLKSLAKQTLEDKGRLGLEVLVTLAGESETVDVELRRAK